MVKAEIIILDPSLLRELNKVLIKRADEKLISELTKLIKQNLSIVEKEKLISLLNTFPFRNLIKFEFTKLSVKLRIDKDEFSNQLFYLGMEYGKLLNKKK